MFCNSGRIFWGPRNPGERRILRRNYARDSLQQRLSLLFFVSHVFGSGVTCNMGLSPFCCSLTFLLFSSVLLEATSRSQHCQQKQLAFLNSFGKSKRSELIHWLLLFQMSLPLKCAFPPTTQMYQVRFKNVFEGNGAFPGTHPLHTLESTSQQDSCNTNVPLEATLVTGMLL